MSIQDSIFYDHALTSLGERMNNIQIMMGAIVVHGSCNAHEKKGISSILNKLHAIPCNAALSTKNELLLKKVVVTHVRQFFQSNFFKVHCTTAGIYYVILVPKILSMQRLMSFWGQRHIETSKIAFHDIHKPSKGLLIKRNMALEE